MVARGYRAPRRLIALGAFLTVLGLAVAGTAPIVGVEGAERAEAQGLGGGMGVILGWAALMWGIHRLGRADPD